MIFCIEVVTMLWVASFGGTIQGGVAHLFGIDDKAMHFLAFALLTMTALSLWCPAWAMMLALVVLAVAVEIMQSVISAREASFGDFIASSAGIVIATVVWQTGVAFWPLLRNDSDSS